MKNKWDPDLYNNKHAFVYKYGLGLVDVLAPRKGEYILDLGCGSGQLTKAISEKGTNVVGIDNSASMIEDAKTRYPELEFHVKDARNFELDQQFNGIISNAVLHWIPEQYQDNVIQTMYNHLKFGGRVALEFGGKDNLANIMRALKDVLSTYGYGALLKEPLWFFSTIGDYTHRMEKVGFRIQAAWHFERETPLEGKDGMINWLKMFGTNILNQVPQEEHEEILEDVIRKLLPTNHFDGKWFADYRRLRIKAIKES